MIIMRPIRPVIDYATTQLSGHDHQSEQAKYSSTHDGIPFVVAYVSNVDKNTNLREFVAYVMNGL